MNALLIYMFHDTQQNNVRMGT